MLLRHTNTFNKSFKTQTKKSENTFANTQPVSTESGPLGCIPSPLPPLENAELQRFIRELVRLAEQWDRGKTSFWNNSADARRLLLDIEWRAMPLRTAVRSKIYQHIAQAVGVGKSSLASRAKMLRQKRVADLQDVELVKLKQIMTRWCDGMSGSTFADSNEKLLRTLLNHSAWVDGVQKYLNLARLVQDVLRATGENHQSTTERDYLLGLLDERIIGSVLAERFNALLPSGDNVELKQQVMLELVRTCMATLPACVAVPGAADNFTWKFDNTSLAVTLSPVSSSSVRQTPVSRPPSTASSSSANDITVINSAPPSINKLTFKLDADVKKQPEENSTFKSATTSRSAKMVEDSFSRVVSPKHQQDENFLRFSHARKKSQHHHSSTAAAGSALHRIKMAMSGNSSKPAPPLQSNCSSPALGSHSVNAILSSHAPASNSSDNKQPSAFFASSSAGSSSSSSSVRGAANNNDAYYSKPSRNMATRYSSSALLRSDAAAPVKPRPVTAAVATVQPELFSSSSTQQSAVASSDAYALQQNQQIQAMLNLAMLTQSSSQPSAISASSSAESAALTTLQSLLQQWTTGNQAAGAAADLFNLASYGQQLSQFFSLDIGRATSATPTTSSSTSSSLSQLPQFDCTNLFSSLMQQPQQQQPRITTREQTTEMFAPGGVSGSNKAGGKPKSFGNKLSSSSSARPPK